MCLHEKHEHEFWYKCGRERNTLFWERLGGAPDFKGRAVLEIGCGTGRLAVDMAGAGAIRVDALDLDPDVIGFAQSNLREHHPELSSVVHFISGDTVDCPSEAYDLVVSKDSFEHVFDLRGLLREITRCLKPGGRLYAGFGPLYNSPTGDHGVALSRLPWGHVLTPRNRVLRRVNRHRADKISSLLELRNVNMLAYRDYCRLFGESGLRQIRWSVNQSDHWVSKILTVLRRIPVLTEYCTHNIYCVMEKAP